MRASGLLAVALGLSVFASAAGAAAFCRTRGCNANNETCSYDEDGCLKTGHVLHWGSSCVSFDVQREGSPLRGISYDAAHEAIRAGFSEWLSADCGDGVGPGVSISDFGPVECRESQYNQNAPNANIFMFRDDAWPYENSIDTLALTTLIFDADTGEIYDADVEVNTFASDMALSDVRRGDIDFASVITHEIGHFLGLSHSRVAESTMRESYSPNALDNTAMATIAADDAQGICAALSPDRSVSRNSCEPRHGFSSACAEPLEDSSCQLSPGSPGAVGSFLIALLGLSSLRLRKRLHPSSRRP